MATPSSRYGKPFDVPLPVPTKGIDYASPLTDINKERVKDAVNWWVSPEGKLEVRPGSTAICTNTAPAKIVGMGYYSTGDKLLLASNRHIYSVARAGGAPTDLGASKAATVSTPVVFAPFLGKVYIASGGTIQVYDGTTLADVTADENGLAVPSGTSLCVWMNRLWAIAESKANHSGAEDPTDWGRDPLADIIQVTNEAVGTGDGSNPTFNLDHFPVYDRENATVTVGGVEQTYTTDYTIDATTGVMTFEAGHIPGSGAAVVATYQYDCEENRGGTLNGASFNVDRLDGDEFSGMAPYFDSLFLFKQGNRNTVHKVTGTSPPFVRHQAAQGLSAVNPSAIIPADSDVLFAGTDGIYSLRIVDQLGNVASMPVSETINPAYSADEVYGGMYDPNSGYFFWFLDKGKLFLQDRKRKSWWRWRFAGIEITAGISVDGYIYFGASNGQVYRLDETKSADNDIAYPKSIVTKAYAVGKPSGRYHAGYVNLTVKTITAGALAIEVRDAYGTDYIQTISPLTGNEPLGAEWDGVGAWDDAAFAWDRPSVISRKVVVKKNLEDFQMQITTSGRIQLLAWSLSGAILDGRRVTRSA